MKTLIFKGYTMIEVTAVQFNCFVGILVLLLIISIVVSLLCYLQFMYIRYLESYIPECQDWYDPTGSSVDVIRNE